MAVTPVTILLTKEQREENIFSNTFGKSKYQMLDLIKIEQLNNFVIKSVNKFGTEKKFDEANKVADVVYQMLKKRKLISAAQSQQSFVDVLLTSALVYNLFFESDDLPTLFYARCKLGEIAAELGIPVDISNTIFQAIEGQAGEDTPVPLCKPNPNSPTELFAQAVWFVEEYEPQV